MRVREVSVCVRSSLNILLLLLFVVVYELSLALCRTHLLFVCSSFCCCFFLFHSFCVLYLPVYGFVTFTAACWVVPGWNDILTEPTLHLFVCVCLCFKLDESRNNNNNKQLPKYVSYLFITTWMSMNP